MSIDDGPIEIVDVSMEAGGSDWEAQISANIAVADTSHDLGAPGEHVVKFWLVDPGVVLRRIVVDTGGLPRYWR